MKKSYLIILLLITSFFSFSQQLTYKSGGNILDSKNNKMSPTEIRELLSKNTQLLKLYNSGKSNKTVGNIFLFSGLGLITADLANGLFGDTQYPTALTAVGTVFVIIGIPVKIGYSKKIKKVVEDYNKQLVYNDENLKIESISFVTNNNGLGLQIKF